jgi:CubicO group peptidase (beta-lactamase class C family)
MKSSALSIRPALRRRTRNAMTRLILFVSLCLTPLANGTLAQQPPAQPHRPSQPTQARPPQAQPAQAPDAQAEAAKIDEYLNAAVRAEAFSGAVLVARRGGFVWAKGYGMADYENRVPNTSKTKFRIGSLTKQFTAAAVLLLQERGKLSVEDSVCKHVEPCPEAWQPVRIHHLLSHTSGVPNFTSFPDYLKTMGNPSPPAETVKRFRDLPLEFAPGEGWKYSNSGYVLLGHVVERASGQSYEAFLAENVFKPLKMESTGYEGPRPDAKERAKGYAFTAGDPPRPAAHIDMTLPHAAGALYSTVEDLHKWSESLDAERVLRKSSLEAMFKPVRNDYAYGWGVGRAGTRLRHSHAGGINGFASYIARFPDDGLTVIVLANNEAAPSGRVARDLSAIALGERYEVPVERAVAKVDPKVYDDYVGEYQFAPEFALTVTREGGRLFAQATNQGRNELFPASETNFFFKVVRADITFVKDSEGRVTHLVLNQGGRQQQAKKIK